MAIPSDLTLAEDMRSAAGALVRAVRSGADTPSDARLATLGYLDRAGSFTAAELARLRGVRHQTMRVLLADMADEGLIEGQVDVSDARAVRFSLQQKGLDLLTRSRAARATWMADRWISKLSDAEKDALRMTILAITRFTSPAGAPD